jgi:DNA-binding MarR family transcriptional regulator
MHVVLEVLLAARTFEKKAQAIFRPYGLTPAQFNVLNCLSDQPDGMRASDLASGLIVDPSNITGLLKRMKKEGFLREIESQGDRRQRVVGLSPKGVSAWRRSRRAYERSLRALESELTAMELRVCGEALRKLARKAALLATDK